ncbi:MAG: type IV pilus secretin PilQ [Porticoccaceae bacterium]|nr:type IV pilus secretin PilQ [Porticoccaceae bacterium]MDG1473637.1 type IV pilus secretin PilQ [Porticoccaceae bacterium]
MNANQLPQIKSTILSGLVIILLATFLILSPIQAKDLTAEITSAAAHYGEDVIGIDQKVSRYDDTQEQHSGAVVTDKDLLSTEDKSIIEGKHKRTDSKEVLNVNPTENSHFTPVETDRISLNFKDIPVRDVLQIMADFKSLNLVASASITGKITLKLASVPWNRALDIVLNTSGLGLRLQDNILVVAPLKELADIDRQRIESNNSQNSLAPLETFVARIKYAEASDIYEMFVGSSESAQKETGSGAISNVSSRGSITIDKRTNTIIMTDINEKIDAFKSMLELIDIPVRQVLMEAKIVIADTDFRKEIGASWGFSGVKVRGDGENINLSGIEDSTTSSLDFLWDNIDLVPPASMVDLGVDLGLASPSGSLSLGYLAKNVLVDLELAALESDGFAEIVSQPSIVSADKQKASIKSGVEIPYQLVNTNNTNTTIQTQFKEAVLQLEITPQITPDNRVIMDIMIKQDTLGGYTSTGVPFINVTQIVTQASVEHGETLVLGGIFQSEQIQSDESVPVLGDVPVLGNLFKKQMRLADKREILIFITPKIIDDTNYAH